MGVPWLQSTKHIYNVKDTSTSIIYISRVLQILVFVPLDSLQAHFSPELSICPAQRSKVYSYAAQKKCRVGARSALLSKVHVQDRKSSHHEGILVFKFFKFFNLLSQKQYPLLTQSCLNFTNSN